MYNFDSQKVASYLDKIKKNIATVYKWTASLDKLVHLGVITIEELYDLNQQTLYEKEIAIKFLIEKKLQEYHISNRPLFVSLCMWIIQDWGGIKGAKPATTMPRIDAFITTDKPKYEALPSVSKVGMFMYPHKNIIYDTRVIYALNWILLKQQAGSHYFPIPGGRNSRMNAFDIEVLIRAYHSNKYTPEKRSELNRRNYIETIDKELFVKKEDAYQQAIQLIASVNKILWKGDKANYPFYTEMLLFSAADVEIFHDITKTIQLNINN